MTEIQSSAGVPVITAPPQEPHLPPKEWLKKNLFSNVGNTFITIMTSVVILSLANGLLGFAFGSERQWNAVAVNSRLYMSFAYPEAQYNRIWFSFATLLVLAGLSMAIWRGGTRVTFARLAKSSFSFGVGLAIMVLLAPLSTSGTIKWGIAAGVLLLAGFIFKRSANENEDEGDGRSLSSLTLLVGTFASIISTLWFIPYGRHSFVGDRTPQVMSEPGTVAFSTQLPWTIMLFVLVGAYYLGVVLRDRLPERRTRGVLMGLWLLSPFFLIYLVLRDPSFTMNHVLYTDIPLVLGFLVVGGLLLYALTKPSLGEIGRIAAVLILLVGFGSFLTPMRMIVRIFLIALGFFSLAAPTFSGDKSTRRRYSSIWSGFIIIAGWLITAVNTPSTVEVPGDLFFGGATLTLIVAFFTVVLSYPLGVLLALARTSNMPIFRLLATTFIEFIRGVPLITILIFFSVMLPLFLPEGMHLPEITSVTIGYALFSAAYVAENIRGGLQSVTRGQHEAAEAVGMSTSQKTVFIILPQALRMSIPPMVGHTIGTFKETSLLYIIGLFDLLYVGRSVIPNQTAFIGSTRENLLFVSVLYWVISYSMSKASQRIEKRVGLGER